VSRRAPTVTWPEQNRTSCSAPTGAHPKPEPPPGIFANHGEPKGLCVADLRFRVRRILDEVVAAMARATHRGVDSRTCRYRGHADVIAVYTVSNTSAGLRNTSTVLTPSPHSPSTSTPSTTRSPTCPRQRMAASSPLLKTRSMATLSNALVRAVNAADTARGVDHTLNGLTNRGCGASNPTRASASPLSRECTYRRTSS